MSLPALENDSEIEGGGFGIVTQEAFCKGKTRNLYGDRWEIPIFILGAEAGRRGNASIGSLMGSGVVTFYQLGKKESYTHLTIENLMGNHQFYFNTMIAKTQSDYLTIQKGSGNHKITVKDSGSEITARARSTLDLITDESANANFILARVDGAKINIVDGGVYQFILQDRNE